MSVTVMVTLLFLMPLFQYTPNVVLGAIIVTAVIGLIDLPAAYNIWKIDKFDFLVMLSAFMGVLFISVQGGLALAVSLFISLVFFNDANIININTMVFLSSTKLILFP